VPKVKIESYEKKILNVELQNRIDILSNTTDQYDLMDVSLVFEAIEVPNDKT
jgi:hypothetical protein